MYPFKPISIPTRIIMILFMGVLFYFNFFILPMLIGIFFGLNDILYKRKNK